MKSAIAVAFAATAAALPAPVPQADTTSTIKFAGMSLRSASPIHFGSINANGQQFWIGKDTATYCPEGSVPEACASANSNTTVFTYTNGASTLGLATTVPGGQLIYVTEGDEATGQLAGQLKFTQAHSAATSGPPLYEGFSIVSDTQLQFEGNDWLACPADDFNTRYGIWAASRVAGENAGANCLGFSWRVNQLDDSTPAAWQYTK